MTILKVLHGDVRARSGLETRVGGIVVVGSALAGVAEKISLINASAAGAKGWHQVDNRVLVEAGRISAVDVATSVAIIASVVARSRVDDLHLLDPSVSGCLAEDGSSNSSSGKCELHFVDGNSLKCVERCVVGKQTCCGESKEDC